MTSKSINTEVFSKEVACKVAGFRSKTSLRKVDSQTDVF